MESSKTGPHNKEKYDDERCKGSMCSSFRISSGFYSKTESLKIWRYSSLGQWTYQYLSSLQ
jgi:hypothetical protein